MNRQTSPMLILLGTLLIGIAIGFFIPRPYRWQPFSANGMSPQHGLMNRPGGGPMNGDNPGFRLQRLENALDLDREQRDAFEQTVLRHRDSMRTAMDRQRLAARQHMRRQMQALNEELKGILNDDQYRKWENFYQDRLQNMNRPGMGPARWRNR